ncbi:epoxide hydrolase, soluble (sEH) [Mortierella claussenii]|nr:epoxide hydrolase, soluble (sEH) [Mortierella claussenii]
MNQVTKFDGTHEDLIHDVAFNYYGNRLATCSSDQKIKIWDYNEAEGVWESNISFKAHSCAVLKTSWAHPEYGQVLASCSFDRSVIVWEESYHDAVKKWTAVATLRDGNGTVQDVEFAPNHLGLRLAIVAADGLVKIYEAMDVTSLAHWTMIDSFPVGEGPSRDEEGNHCLSWCTSKFTAQMMVVGCAKDHVAKIFRQDLNNKWQACEILGGHGGVVHDVSWAPNMGRSYHLIATACKDGHVRIFKLTDDNQGGALTGGWTRKMFNVTCIADFADHNAEVWRVEWNITGTILSSSGDDGKVRLWKATYTGDWKCMSVVSAEDGSNAFQR